jgi:glycosyltransferase involved in cell wall biosynthesis
VLSRLSPDCQSKRATCCDYINGLSQQIRWFSFKRRAKSAIKIALPVQGDASLSDKNGDMPASTVPEKQFQKILANYAQYFPYSTFKLKSSPDGTMSLLAPQENGLVQFLPVKADWVLSEFLSFDGNDFAYAVTRALAGRAPTSDEVSRMSAAAPWQRLDFILEINDAARHLGLQQSVVDAGKLNLIWRTTRQLKNGSIPLLSSAAGTIFRAACSSVLAREAPSIVSQRLLYQCIQKVAALSEKIGESAPSSKVELKGKKRRHVVIANFCAVWPPVNGGQRRVFFLARELSRTFEVEIVTLDRSGSSRTLQLGPNLKEICVAADAGFRNLEVRLHYKVSMSSDLAYTLHWQHCHAYQDVLDRCLADSDIVISSHPYSFYAIQAALQGRKIPIIYDAHNCELEEKEGVLADFPDGLQAIRDVEAAALRGSALTIACAATDAESFSRHYGVKSKDIKIVENGVDAIGVPLLEDKYVAEIRGWLGVKDRLMTVFGGSYYHPNFRAADAILELCRQLPQVTFVMLGGVCQYEPVKSAGSPNLIRLGQVDEDLKWLIYNLSDMGLNPMMEGSGTAVKMFEYAAASLTILSTPWGARGIPLADGGEQIVSDIAGWAPVLEGYAAMPRLERKKIGNKSRETIEKTSDWSVLGKRYREYIGKILADTKKPAKRGGR